MPLINILRRGSNNNREEQQDNKREGPEDKEKKEVEDTEEKEQDKSWEDRQEERRLWLVQVCRQHKGETNMRLKLQRAMG